MPCKVRWGGRGEIPRNSPIRSQYWPYSTVIMNSLLCRLHVTINYSSRKASPLMRYKYSTNRLGSYAINGMGMLDRYDNRPVKYFKRRKLWERDAYRIIVPAIDMIFAATANYVIEKWNLSNPTSKPCSVNSNICSVRVYLGKRRISKHSSWTPLGVE